MAQFVFDLDRDRKSPCCTELHTSASHYLPLFQYTCAQLSPQGLISSGYVLHRQKKGICVLASKDKHQVSSHVLPVHDIPLTDQHEGELCLAKESISLSVLEET